jgi:hypothetical protein
LGRRRGFGGLEAGQLFGGARFFGLVGKASDYLVGDIGHGPAELGPVAFLCGGPDDIARRIDKVHGGNRFVTTLLDMARLIFGDTRAQ